MASRTLLLAATALPLCLGSAMASPLSGTGGADAALTGGTVQTFDTAPAGTYTSLTLGAVTYTGVDGVFHISTDFVPDFNTRGVQALENTRAPGSFTTLRFDFASPVSAFAFNWGASDSTWNLAAYTAGGTLIEAADFPPTHASNAGDYIGLSDPGIAYAILALKVCTVDCPIDYVFVDNFTYIGGSTPTPEPISLALLGTGLLGLGVARRR